MNENDDPSNIVGNPSPEMTGALKRQDEIQKAIKDQREIEDLASKIYSVLGSEYTLAINGQDAQQAKT
jgi:hypothetical protein